MVLGGCNLTDGWQKEAAKDEQAPQTALSMPQADDDNSLEGIEKDLTETEILDEDFSDLE